MRITYIHQYFNTPSMPGGTRSYEMARRLVSMGHEVNVITSFQEQGKKPQWFETKESGINVHWFPIPYSNNMTYSQRLKAFLIFIWRSSSKAALLKADIIFATSTPLTVAIPAVYASYKHKVPMVFEVRDLWPEIPIAMGILRDPISCAIARGLESWAYRHSEAIIALSPGMKTGVASTGFPLNRIAVIPNSSDNKEFKYNEKLAKDFRSDRPWIADDPLLVYAGTFGKMNGVGYAVALAKELIAISSDIKILLVGDGAERNTIINEAKKAGVFEKNIFFEGKMPKEQVPALLSAATMSASFFINLPEMRNNSANKFFDSLAAGKPVFLNYGGWMHDLVLSHKCGFAAWEKPTQEVAVELDKVMHDLKWLYKSGLSAQKLAEKKFDRDVLALQLENILVAVQSGDLKLVEQIIRG